MVLAITTAYTADLPTFTLPNSFTNNSIADANQVNANFNKLKDEVLVNRTAINNLHFGVMAGGVEVGVLQSFQPFSTVSSVAGQNSQGYNFAVDQNGAFATIITDSDLQVQTINTSQSCSGSAQPILLVKKPNIPNKSVFRINLGLSPLNPGSWSLADMWGYPSGGNSWNGTYSLESTIPTFSTISAYSTSMYGCNVSQTFTGPFFTPIPYVHSNYNAPDITPLGLVPNNQTNTGVPNGGFTGPLTIKVQH